MSITDSDSTDQPNPPEDPETVIREDLGEHKEAIEALTDLDMGVLSEDARRALEILDQEDPS